MPSLEIFADEIFYFKNVLEDPYSLLQDIEDTDKVLTASDALSKWYQWQSSNDDYIFGEKKDTFLHNIPSSSEKVQGIVKSIQNVIDYVESEYLKHKDRVIGEYAPVCINKYFTGKGMGPHVDGYEGASNNPVMSAVLYVNDDYEGGTIDFPNQGLSIKPEAGSVVMFPSTQPFVHSPNEIISGEKVMCPAFWFIR